MNSGEKKRRGMVAMGADLPSPDARRRMLADWCKLLGVRLIGLPAAKSVAAVEASASASPALPLPSPAPAQRDPLAGVHLSGRERQILTCLLVGDSEKQIALKLAISPHTVHTYVKKLHKTLDVNSRGELMAKFVVL